MNAASACSIRYFNFQYRFLGSRTFALIKKHILAGVKYYPGELNFSCLLFDKVVQFSSSLPSLRLALWISLFHLSQVFVNHLHCLENLTVGAFVVFNFLRRAAIRRLRAVASEKAAENTSKERSSIFFGPCNDGALRWCLTGSWNPHRNWRRRLRSFHALRKDFVWFFTWHDRAVFIWFLLWCENDVFDFVDVFFTLHRISWLCHRNWKSFTPNLDYNSSNYISSLQHFRRR